MTNPRKVQGEIDKLLKKVQEGMEVYDDINEKVEAAPDQAAKLRVEADLKKEIKKLQRLREQVKGYIASSEVKDKKALETARRNVEIKMEAFKITERETKTKAFSKEGLAAAARADPNTPKGRTCDWLRDAIADLGEKQEQLDFDIEAEQTGGAGAGGKKKGANKLAELEERMERLKVHVKRCEQLMRSVNRDDIEPQDVDDIRDDVEAFVEGALDPNFEEENPDIYDMFDLPDMDDDDDDDDDDDRDDDDGEPAPPPAKPAPKKAAAAAAAASSGATSPLASRQGSAVHDDKGGKAGAAAGTGVVVLGAGAKTPPTAAGATSKAPSAAAAVASSPAVGGKSSAAAAVAPAVAPAAKGGAKAAAPEPAAPGKKGAAQQQPSVSSTSSTPASPSKSMTPAKSGSTGGDPLMGSPAGSGVSSQGGLGGGGGGGLYDSTAAAAPGDADGLLDDDDDALNGDTFGDDAMAAVGQGAGNLSDLAAMTSKADPIHAGGAGSTATPQKPANVWAAKKQMMAAAGPAPALPEVTPAVSAPAPAQPKVKSAWSQPLSSLVAGAPADKKPPPPSQMPTLGEALAGAAALTGSAPGEGNSSHTPLSNAKTSALSPKDAVGGSGNVSSPATPQQQQQNVSGSGSQQQQQSKDSSLDSKTAPQPAAPPLQVPQQVDFDQASTARLLDMSLRNLPQPSDVERLKPYVPANPQPTPNYYPQKIPPCFSNPELFQRFEPDTLFFIFYYQQGTYQHYLAAKELKRNSYRFHKKFTTWFQRHDRPRKLDEEQEQGTYVYFDFESGWCQRIKNDFAFRYQFLENELV